jgi:glycerol-3-phosphate acyltransferase PlsX
VLIALSEENKSMRIVVDAMGSDEHPVPDIAGAILAARELGDTIILVGDEAAIKRHLTQHDTANLHLEVVHADETVEMTDKPSAVGKSKPRSSLHVGLNLVKDGEASAFVTMGNTGAVLAIATLHTLRRIPGIKRPALCQVIRITDRQIMILDIGANADSKPEWLAQFAIMGRVYMQNVLHIVNPRVALLSNGEEEGKGNQLIHETSALLQQLELNYIGNIEPKDALRGRADVIVADGFVGNIAVKTFEASARFLGSLIRDELKSDVLSMAGGLLSRPALRRVYKKVDPFEVGGALLLGVNGVVIIGHGRSNAIAVKNAIRQAQQAVAGQVVESIKQGLLKTLHQE